MFRCTFILAPLQTLTLFLSCNEQFLLGYGVVEVKEQIEFWEFFGRI